MEPTPPAGSDVQLSEAEIAKKKQKKADKKLIALERVRLALERLQLAWNRFAIVLAAFGFTIARILQEKMAEGRSAVLGVITGREIGLLMLTIGIVGLLFSTRQHIRSYRLLKKRYPDMPASVSLMISFIILAFTTFMLLVVLLGL